MTSSIKSDIRFELLVPVLVYRPNFGLIETTLKIGPTGNPPLPVNRSEIQKTKSNASRGIKFSICQYIVLWGFKIPESRHLGVAPKKKPPRWRNFLSKLKKSQNFDEFMPRFLLYLDSKFWNYPLIFIISEILKIWAL